jgi:hypothetical protein
MSLDIATQLEQEATKRMYERLILSRDKSNVYDDSIIKDIEGSRMFQNVFCCNDPVYSNQIDTIIKSKPNIVIDDTVGSYLYGCFQPELAVAVACTPACSNGLKNPNLKPCEMASYEKKGNLVKINTVTGDEANVFIANGNSFTNDDRKILRDQSIKVATLYTQDGKSINYVLGESVDVTKDQPVQQPVQQPESTQSTQSSAWFWSWIIIVIVIIIIMIIAFYLAR